MLLAAGAVGCDGSLRSGTELDRSPLHLAGAIAAEGANESDSEPLAGETHLAFGVLWVDVTQRAVASVVSSSDLLTSAISPNGKYTLDFQSSPPERAIRWLDASAADDEPSAVAAANAGDAFAFAFGELVLFDDIDGDGSFRVGSLTDGSPMLPPDEYRGMASRDVVLYVARALPRGRNPLPEISDRITGVEGYHLGKVDCSDLMPFVSPADPSNAPIELVPASASFPDVRACLRSQPSSGAR